jgi:hypothetical protein
LKFLAAGIIIEERDEVIGKLWNDDYVLVLIEPIHEVAGDLPVEFFRGLLLW